MDVQAVHHPAEETLLAYGSGKLDENQAMVVAAHLENCPECCDTASRASSDSFLDRVRAARADGGTPVPHMPLTGLSQSVKGKDSPVPSELRDHPQYQVIRELGCGGMGVVYLAKHKLMNRLEVLKVVNRQLLSHPEAKDRFLREIRLAAELAHTNIVRAYSALEIGELLVLAMEYVDGQDLSRTVKAGGPLSVPHACFYVQEAALGLQHAFEKGVVHRDIKPQNIIVAREGRKHLVKILDFGLAKACREKGNTDSSLTGSGTALGTPDYMAPEQIRDAAEADIRADIYSLGCTLYYLVTGHPPFQEKNLFYLTQAHLIKEARPLNQVRREVLPGLAAVAAKMMAKEPKNRYQQPIEVKKALAPFVKATTQSTAAFSVPTAENWGSEFFNARESDANIGTLLQPSPQSVQKKWVLGAGITLALLVALIGSWASGVFRIRTPNGTLEVHVNEPKPDVYVDGRQVAVTWGPDGKKAEIQIMPGTRKVEVKKDGFTVYGEELTLEAGGRKIVTARLDSQRKSPITNDLRSLRPGMVFEGTKTWTKTSGPFQSGFVQRIRLAITEVNEATFIAVFSVPSSTWARKASGEYGNGKISWSVEGGADLFVGKLDGESIEFHQEFGAGKMMLLVQPLRFVNGIAKNFIDPSNDCILQDVYENTGSFKISVPETHHDLFPRMNMNGPRVLVDVTGDFLGQVKVTGSMAPLPNAKPPGDATDYRAGVLMIWKDAGNFIRLNRACYGNLNEIRITQFKSGDRFVDNSVQCPDEPMTLRLERRGKTIFSSWLDPHGTTFFERLIVDWPATVKIGAGVINNKSGVPVQIQFEGFKVGNTQL